MLQSEPENYLVSNIKEALIKIENQKTVFHCYDTMLQGAYKKHPKRFPSIKTFGAEKPLYNAILTSQNSPLTPIFTRESIKIQQMGEYERLFVYWIGGSIPENSGGVEIDSMVLTPGQVALIFCVLTAAMVVSFFILITEILLKKTKAEHRFDTLKESMLKTSIHKKDSLNQIIIHFMSQKKS